MLSTGLPGSHPDMQEIQEVLGPDFPMDRLVGGLGYRFEVNELRACDYGAPTIRKRFFLVARCDGRPIIWPRPTHAPKGKTTKTDRSWKAVHECVDFRRTCPSIFLTEQEGRALRVKRPLVRASEARIAKGIFRYVMQEADPFIVSLTHQGGDRIQSVAEPFKTITGANRGEKALVVPLVARQFGTGGCHSATEPMKSVMAGGGGGKNQVVSAFLCRQFGMSVGSSAEQPIGTITSGGGGKTQVIASFLAQNNTGVVGHSVREPISSILGTGSHQSVVECSLINKCDVNHVSPAGKPLDASPTQGGNSRGITQQLVPTLTAETEAKARRVAAFLRSYGIEFPGEFATCRGLVIYDVGMRMFTPRELFSGQGFPSDYIIEYGIDEGGIRIPLTKTDQIKMCGNAVPPQFGEAILTATVPEMSVWPDNQKLWSWAA